MRKNYPLNRIFNHWIDEYQGDVRFGLRGKVIVEEKTKFQKITIFESQYYGKVLALNNSWMTAEKQEKQYHECLVHPALSSSLELNNVLIIGGGDGGTARECLKYKDLKCLDLVEIDSLVIEMSQKYLSKIGGNCWQDQRLNVHIKDGAKSISLN